MTRAHIPGPRRLGRPRGRDGPRARPRRPGRRDRHQRRHRHPLRRHRRRGRHRPQGERRHPRRRRHPPSPDRAPHQLGHAPDRVPRPGQEARRLRLRRGQLQLARLLAVRRRDRDRGPQGHRRRLESRRLGPREHAFRPRPHRHGGRLVRGGDQPPHRRPRPPDQGGRRAQRLGRPHRVHLQRPHPAPPGRRPARRRRIPDGPTRSRTQGDPGRLPLVEPRQGGRDDRLGPYPLPRRPPGPDQRQRRRDHARQRLGDTIFPPNQYASFFEKLTGPKRLEFRPGDHATAEATGLFGLPNDTWTSAHRWFDRHLKGVDNGIDREQPVQLKSRSISGYEGYPDWKSVHANQRKFDLDGTQRIWANVDSGANGGITLLTNALDQFLRTPPSSPSPCCPAPSPASGSRNGTTPRSGCAAR